MAKKQEAKTTFKALDTVAIQIGGEHLVTDPGKEYDCTKKEWSLFSEYPHFFEEVTDEKEVDEEVTEATDATTQENEVEASE